MKESAKKRTASRNENGSILKNKTARRSTEILRFLAKSYPDARIALHHGNEFQLLVAVILSAQCTDERVNKVTPGLFKKYPGVRDFAKADITELEQLIYSTGFYWAKAKNIRSAALKIVQEFGGKMPDKMEDLLKLPGVARKTANVVLSAAFGKNEGIVVDTHVIRLSGRMGFVDKKLSTAKNAVKIEQELIKIVPREDWGKFAHQMIMHGRKICTARKPKCGDCTLNKVCPSAFKF